MTQRNEGSPAFPVPGLSQLPNDQFLHPHHGMSLRDYFAAQAMPEVWRDIPEDANRLQALSYLGRCSYEMADAMLAARERT